MRNMNIYSAKSANAACGANRSTELANIGLQEEELCKQCMLSHSQNQFVKE